MKGKLLSVVPHITASHINSRIALVPSFNAIGTHWANPTACTVHFSPRRYSGGYEQEKGNKRSHVDVNCFNEGSSLW